ncbi:MAG: hypothetical protein CV089_24710, partial [Nitrospira sp. WS110]|nr:hypothetical protein [Nitrospira sp. WS110]
LLPSPKTILIAPGRAKKSRKDCRRLPARIIRDTMMKSGRTARSGWDSPEILDIPAHMWGAGSNKPHKSNHWRDLSACLNNEKAINRLAVETK